MGGSGLIDKELAYFDAPNNVKEYIMNSRQTKRPAKNHIECIERAFWIGLNKYNTTEAEVRDEVKRTLLDYEISQAKHPIVADSIIKQEALYKDWTTIKFESTVGDFGLSIINLFSQL
jgi:hypothetical protein